PTRATLFPYTTLFRSDRTTVAAGHTRNDEGQPQPVAEEDGADGDLFRVDRRERIVHEMDVLPSRAGSRLDVALGRELEVLALPRSEEHTSELQSRSDL